MIEVPLSDGGEGFVEILASHPGRFGETSRPGGFEQMTTTVDGPLGLAIDVPWLLAEGGFAILEAALVCGHRGIRSGARDPMAASTRGVGQVLAVARNAGVRRMLVGVGGTVTTDGGRGALDALGWSSGGLELTVAVDTRVRFRDAGRVFGPQKGASAEEVVRLSERLDRAAAAILRRTGIEVAEVDGTGAGGGLAGGLLALGGVLRPGIEIVASTCRLHEHLRRADLVITGEGRFDHTSVRGKAVGWVLERAQTARRAVMVGDADADALLTLPPDVHVSVLRRSARDELDSMSRAAELLGGAASALAAATILDGCSTSSVFRS